MLAGMEWHQSEAAIRKLKQMLWGLEALRVFRDKLQKALEELKLAQEKMQKELETVSNS